MCAIPRPAIWLDPQRGCGSVTFTFRWRFSLSAVPCCYWCSNVGRHGWLPGPLIHTPGGKLLNPTDSTICLSNCSLSFSLSSAHLLSQSLSLYDSFFPPFTNNLIVLSQSCECGNNLQHSEDLEMGLHIEQHIVCMCLYTVTHTSRGFISRLLKQHSGDQQKKRNSVDRRCRYTRCSHALYIPNRAGESSHNNHRVIISN